MRKSKLLVITTFLFLLLFVPTKALAQEDSIKERTVKIIVETDLEEPLSNVPVVCTSTTHNFDSDDDNNILTTKLTDENGEVELVINDTPNTSYRCSSESITTNDGCWFFPTKSKFISYQDPVETLYIVGLESSETCNKELPEEETQAQIEELLGGEPPTFKNSHVQEVTHYQDEMNKSQNSDSSEYKSEIEADMSRDGKDGSENARNIFEWFFIKIRNVFRR